MDRNNTIKKFDIISDNDRLEIYNDCKNAHTFVLITTQKKDPSRFAISYSGDSRLIYNAAIAFFRSKCEASILFQKAFINMRNEQTDATRNLSFSQALDALKDNKKVCREAWNSRYMFIVLIPALYLPPFNTQDTNRKVNDRTAKWIGADQPLDCQPYIALYTDDRKWQPGWIASQADLLANDWCIL